MTALNFNPQTLIDNPALIRTFGATVNAQLEINGDFASVRVSVEFAGNAWVISMGFEPAIKWLEMVGNDYAEYRVLQTFGSFSVSTLI